jgi:hypothetical protein
MTNLNKMANKEKLAMLNFCRTFLYLNGIISQSQSEKIHTRILAFQDKERIEITQEELDSVEMIYNPSPQTVAISALKRQGGDMAH